MCVLGSICRAWHKTCDFNLYKSKSLLSKLIYHNGSRAQGNSFSCSNQHSPHVQVRDRRYSFSTWVTPNFNSNHREVTMTRAKCKRCTKNKSLSMNNAQEWHPLFFDCNKKKKDDRNMFHFLTLWPTGQNTKDGRRIWSECHLTFKKSHRKLNITGGQTQSGLLSFVVSAWRDNMEPLASTWVWR